MPLSSVLGAQSLVRPGVCTSSTRPASPFEGQVIYETDTNRIVAYDGSAWVYVVDTDQPPALQHIKTQTIGTAVSSVEVTDVFSADFDIYKIIISGGVASTAVVLRCQLGSTTTGYYWAHNYRTYGAITGANEGANTANFGRLGLGTTDTLAANFELVNPFASKHTVLNYSYVDPRAVGGEAGAGGGFLNNTTSYTSFTITPSTGTLTGGTIRVYGYRNS